MSRGPLPRATVRLAARAKVNLRLHILARELTGYHQIETLFCALDYADDVDITLGGDGLRFELECLEGVQVESGPDNLVCRAAERFFAALQRPASATIRLKKRIPAGAGLGGGSSDCASTLKGLNLLCNNPIPDAQLLEIGASLGADVPFFLCGSSLALAWGRGQRLAPLPPLPSMPTLVVVPPFPILTRDAYQALQLPPSSLPRVTPPDRLQSWEAVQEDAGNDFEAALFPRFPQLAELRDALRSAGATTALLAGSGSALFGLFPLRRTATLAARKIRDRWADVRTLETETHAWSAY
jgi:4-diphosphocytidyl-2-C-methyl-D-erythritol kinase